MSFEGRAPYQREQDGQSDQRRRLAALRGLAEQSRQPSQPSDTRDTRAQAVTQPRRAVTPPSGQRDLRGRRPAMLGQQQPMRSRRLPVIVVAALVVTLIAGGAVWVVRSRQPVSRVVSQPPMPAVRTINLAVNNLSCPLHLAWSPDGTQIAILATLGDCTNQYTGGPELAIFDARTGKLTHGYALDSVFTKQGISTKLASLLFAWAPDGSALIVAAGYDPYQAPPPGTPHGLISITVATGAVRFVADTTTQTSDGATLIWDTRTGKLIHTIAELAPATAYTWGADGSLAPSVAGAAGKGAVSIWRSGSISPIYAVAGNENTPPPANQVVPQLIVFISSEPGWSPDGRYLALPLNVGVRLPGGANAYPNVGCATGFAAACQSVPTAVPDKGFSAALAAFEAGWSPSPLWNNQAVVWRADGQELVTLLPGQDFNTGKSTATLTIFNTHTGAVVRTLTINRVAVDFGYGAAPQIAWSPRGASLAALNYGDATLILWRAE